MAPMMDDMKIFMPYGIQRLYMQRLQQVKDIIEIER